jgi:hypothetical protein
MTGRMTLFELKEKAKWSREPDEKKTAIKELSAYGADAVPSLEEILNTAVYEDIKAACAEAIKVIMANSGREELEASKSSESGAAVASDTAAEKVQKKEEKASQGRSPEAKRES